jgi:erythronate-4-phosphate dehydrogenase
MKIVCDDKIPYLHGVLEPYVDKVVYLPGTKISNADLLTADALIVRTRTKCTATLLENTPVRFIATATIGYDHIDTAYCDKHGIVWTNAPGCNSGSVKQYIAASLACLSNRRGFSLAGKTIGIVGVGNVGSKVFDVAKAFGMHVLLNDPPRAEKEGENMFVALDELLGKSDIITLHVPLSYEGAHKTYHLLNKKILENLQEHQIIINSSRGEVVDNTALASVLKRKRITGAVLDVWEDEPDIHRELLSLADITTPHIAGYSRDGKGMESGHS